MQAVPKVRSRKKNPIQRLVTEKIRAQPSTSGYKNKNVHKSSRLTCAHKHRSGECPARSHLYVPRGTDLCNHTLENSKLIAMYRFALKTTSSL